MLCFPSIPIPIHPEIPSTTRRSNCHIALHEPFQPYPIAAARPITTLAFLLGISRQHPQSRRPRHYFGLTFPSKRKRLCARSTLESLTRKFCTKRTTVPLRQKFPTLQTLQHPSRLVPWHHLHSFNPMENGA